MINIQNYKKVSSLDEAWELNQKRSNRVLGGMLWMKMSSNTVHTAIDLSGLGLDLIEETPEEFRIGCMATLRQLEIDEALNRYTGGAIKEALRHIVGVQFRNLATLGGSIYGRFGFSDVLTLFMAMDSYVELHKGGIIPLREFAAQPYDRDILVRLIVKKQPATYFYEAVRISQTDLPVLTCAAARVKNENADEYRVVIGARPGRAIIVNDANNLLSGDMTPEKAQAFGDYAASVVPTASNTRAGAEYRSHLVNVLCTRAVVNLGGITNAD